jgi:hypothetical protein
MDSLNIYVNGTRQVKRVSKEYAYLKSRDYLGGTTRNAGLFSAMTLWHHGSNNVQPYTYIDTTFWCRILLDTLTVIHNIRLPIIMDTSFIILMVISPQITFQILLS